MPATGNVRARSRARKKKLWRNPRDAVRDEAALERYLIAHAPGFAAPLARVQQFRGGHFDEPQTAHRFGVVWADEAESHDAALNLAHGVLH